MTLRPGATADYRATPGPEDRVVLHPPLPCEESMDNQPDLITDRARALVECPAKAPDPANWGSERDMQHEDERHPWAYDPIVEIAAAYLEQLPTDQRAELRVDTARRRVIVQVTYDPAGVLTDLRQRVDNPESVEVEQVRYSRAELREWARVIMELRDLELSTVGTRGANNRIDVGVPGDAAAAWPRIAQVVDPCAFRVEGGIRIVPL